MTSAKTRVLHCLLPKPFSVLSKAPSNCLFPCRITWHNLSPKAPIPHKLGRSHFWQDTFARAATCPALRAWEGGKKPSRGRLTEARDGGAICMGKKWLDFKLREREMGWIRSTRSAVSRAGGGVRVQAGPLRGPPPSQPRAQRPGERSLGASPRSSSPRPAHAQQRGKRAPDAGAAASTFTKKTASTLHFPELGKRPTSSAWAVITHSAITSSLGTRRDREAGMSAGSRARRKETKEKKLLTRAETQKLPERWKRGTGAQQEGPEGAAEGRGVTKADRPALTAPGLDSQPQLRLVDGTRGWPPESPCLRHVPWGSPPPPPPSGSGRRGKSSWELHAAAILGHPSLRGLWKRPRAGSASPDPISSPSVPRRATQSPGAEVSLIWVPPSPQPPSSRHPAVTRAGTEPWTDPREFPTARWLSLRSPRNKVASPLPRAYSTPLPSSPRLPSLREPACKGLRVAGREREEGTKRSSQRARPSLGSALPESSSLGCALRKASGGCPGHKSLCLGVPPV